MSFEAFILKLRPYIPFSALNTVWRQRHKSSRTILDVGCGKGEPMAFINRHGKFKVVGIDIFKPYLEEARKKSYVLSQLRTTDINKCSDVGEIYLDLILGDVRRLPFKDKSFDAIICMEVLEHLEKHDGEKLLEELERLARGQILLSTPVGKYKQHPFEGNPYQQHKYIWQASDLRKRGYRIKGMGLKGLPREEINSRFLKLLREVLYILGGLFSYNLPEIACHIVGEKRLIA